MFHSYLTTDVACDIDNWLDLLEQLNPKTIHCDWVEEVWQLAKTYDSFPHFGNFYQYLVLEKLSQTIDECYGAFGIQLHYDVNGCASHCWLRYDSSSYALEQLNELITSID